jgi:2-iminoacetate synthase
MSFVEMLDRTDIEALRRTVETADAQRVEAALSRGATSFSDFLALVSPVATEYLEPMAQRARETALRRFGRTILMYAPIYLSNACVNGCRYCGFNTKSGIKRKALDDLQAMEEGQYLRSLGFQHVLLVSGESPSDYTRDRLLDAIRALSPLFASTSIEVQALSESDYAAASEAGADGVTLYQETYNRPVYSEMHPSGPKRDFANRLDAMERAGRAGMRRLGIGALLGLHDFRSEAIALCLHAEYLMKSFWRTNLTLSVPRLRNAAAGFLVPSPVGDRDLVQLLLAFRIHFPDVGLVLSTREPPALRDALIPLGITQMSAGSKTDPGGYCQDIDAGAQFEVEDPRTPAEMVEVIRRAGYEPVWKDWDNLMHGGASHDYPSERTTARIG